MSSYAKRHHPQVQARKTGIALNSFKRDHYAAALKIAGVPTTRKLTKAELWKLVRATPSALTALLTHSLPGSCAHCGFFHSTAVCPGPSITAR